MTGLSKVPRAEHWAGRIRIEMGKTVESVIETGRLLVKAKNDLAHGEFGRMFEERLVPFSQRAADMLMKVALNPQLSNSNHGSNLPPSWRTLYELACLPEPTLKHALHDGLITPDMERSHVKKLLPLAPGLAQPSEEEAIEAEVIEDGDQSDTAPTAHRARVVGPPSNGVQFARIAIMNLEEIREDDIERDQAFTLIRSWLDARQT